MATWGSPISRNPNIASYCHILSIIFGAWRSHEVDHVETQGSECPEPSADPPWARRLNRRVWALRNGDGYNPAYVGNWPEKKVKHADSSYLVYSYTIYNIHYQ